MRRRTVLLLTLALCFGLSGWLCWRYLIRGPEYPRNSSGILYDPIEDDPKVRPYLEAAGKEASEENKGAKAPAYFRIKKRILKEKYGIDWRTPAELNPDWAFD